MHNIIEKCIQNLLSSNPFPTLGLFIKKAKILKCFPVFLNFQNHFFFWKYKISFPFSLVEAKTHVFNIYIGYASWIYLLQNEFLYFLFSH